MQKPNPSSNEKPNTGETPKAKTGEAVADKVKGAYQWWDNLATLNAEDPIWVSALKVGVRVIGVIVLIAISPLAILGLIMGLMAVA